MTFGGEIKPVAIKVPTMQALMEQAIEDLDGFSFSPSYCSTKEKKKTTKLHSFVFQVVFS